MKATRRLCHIPPVVCLLLVSVFLTAGLPLPVTQAAPQEPSAVSHLGPHLRSAVASQLSAHTTARLPQELTERLAPGRDSIIKGYSPTWEGALARDLLAVDLRHDIIRVAVAEYQSDLMALVKLQAGDKRDGTFDAGVLQDDAVTALSVAFDLAPRMQSVDVWAVVPGDETREYAHVPVFSVSVRRGDFIQAVAEPRKATHILGRLGLVRFSPNYLRYAGGGYGSGRLLGLPVSTYDAPPTIDNWEEHVAEAYERLTNTEGGHVKVLEPLRGPHGLAALTIDDGPHPLTTPLMLAVLRDHGVHATFFLVAEKAEEYPELVRRIARGGHEIANHSHANRRASQLRDAELLAEITACQDVIGRITGMATKYFRPPGGRVTKGALRALGTSEHTVVMWTNNADDWLKPKPRVIAANALEGLGPGAIILMHQGSMESFHALPMIIEGASAAGVQLGTLSELVAVGGAVTRDMSMEDALPYLRERGYLSNG